jgi:hypothetical protein
MTPIPDGQRIPWLALALGAALLLVVALRFALPIEDGDLFWHMAYGSQMIERGTLRTDHTLYSWMPASNDTIYCAWTGELLFLGLEKACGIAGFFALRYAAALAVLAMLAWQARRMGLLARPEAWLVLLVTLLASVVGATFPKPEMLSFVLWNGLVFCWFGVLWAVEERRNALPWIYAIPILMLVWVNTHGGFILAAPFLAIVAVAGFWMLPRREAGHLAAAVGLCALVTVVNPYGVRYPLQLVQFAMGFGTKRPDIAWNTAFQPTWSQAGQFLHLPEFLGWMALGLAAACFRRRRGWMVVVLLFLAYVPLYLLYVRSTFLLPAVFGYGVLYLARGVTGRRWSAVLVCVLFAGFAGRTVYQARFHPDTDAWMGFGVSYSQPVEEAGFLAQGNFGPKIYNTYNAGGYLLWRLYPRYQVMVDARSFPFVGWFDELRQFMRTQDPAVFRGFLKRHPGNVALVDFQEDYVWRSFLETPGWRPAFYGPSAAVFVRAVGPERSVAAARSLGHLRNGGAGYRVFNFARAVGDFHTAWSVLDQLQGPLRDEMEAETLEPMQAYRDGHAALRAGNYKLASECFARSFQHSPAFGRDAAIQLILRALAKEPAVDDQQAEKLRAGLAHLQAPE